MDKRILITGGAGFIGSHICELFLEQGDRVEIIDNLSTGKRENVPAAALLHHCDIRSPDAARIVREGAFDAIVHLAAQTDVRKSVADPLHDASVNIAGALNVAESLRRSSNARACRMVFASTGGALYGDFATPPTAETAAKDPESPYAVAKLGIEYYLAYYGRVHGFDPVALRYGNVYGPRQDPHGEAGVVAIFCGRILYRKPLTIFGDGTQTRDYVYVTDVAAATYLAATKRLPAGERLDSRAFNIGTGVGTPVNDVARLLLRVAKSGVAVQHAPRRHGEQQQSFLDVSKAASALGWQASVSLEIGLQRTFQWFAGRELTAPVDTSR